MENLRFSLFPAGQAENLKKGFPSHLSAADCSRDRRGRASLRAQAIFLMQSAKKGWKNRYYDEFLQFRSQAFCSSLQRA